VAATLVDLLGRGLTDDAWGILERRLASGDTDGTVLHEVLLAADASPHPIQDEVAALVSRHQPATTLTP
jgi:hypothetical protein